MKNDWKPADLTNTDENRIRHQISNFKFQIILLLIFCAAMLIAGGCVSQEDHLKAEPPTEKAKLITDITTDDSPESFDILIRGNRVLTYTSVKQISPLGVILYFSETELDSEFERAFSENSIVRSLRTSRLTDNGNTARIEILLRKDMPWEITRDEDTGVRLSFAGNAGNAKIPTGDHRSGPPRFGTPSEIGNTGPPMEVWDPKRKVWVAESLSRKTQYRGISETSSPEFRSHATRLQSVYAKASENGLKIFVGADGPITKYKSFTIESPARIVFDIFDVRSPYKNEKKVSVNSEWVRQVRYYAYPDRVRVVLDTKKAYLSDFRANPSEDGLLIRMGAADADDPPLFVRGTHPSAARVQSVYASRTENGVLVTVRGDGSIGNYKSFVEQDPPRIIVDMFNVRARAGEEENAFPVDTEWVRQVHHTTYPDKVRLVIDTRKPYLSTFSVSPDRNGLVIHVGDGQASFSRVAKPETEIRTPTPGFQSGLKTPELKTDSKPALVDLVVFSPEEAGKSTLIIETSGPVTHDIRRSGDRKLEVRLPNAKIPEYRHEQGAMLATHSESAVDKIMPVRATAGETDMAVFEIELREFVPYFVEQTEVSGKHHLMVHFEASSISPRPAMLARETGIAIAKAEPEPARIEVRGEKHPAPEDYLQLEPPPQSAQPDSGTPLPPAGPGPGMTPQTASSPLPPAGPGSGMTPLPPAGPGSPGVNPSLTPEADDKFDEILEEPEKRYTGEKIALDFYDTDIKNVFRILREVSGKNFAIDKDVSGKVTLTLDRPVPWDQVLDLILKMNQLGMTYEGDIVRISTMKTIQADEKIMQDRKLKAQQAREKQKELERLFTEYIAISYSKAKTEILPHVNNILSKGRGTASVDDRTNTLIITDTAETIGKAKEIVQKLDRVTPQVVIEARIVEASTNFSKGIGVSWGAKSGFAENYYNSNYGLDQKIGVGPQRGYDEIGGTYGYDMAMNLPANVLNAASIGFSFMRIAGTPFQLDARLTAMESLGQGKIISAPKIVTLDNKTAKISQGLDYPYNKLDKDGNSTTTFFKIDLSLEVTPHVTPDNRISMTIKVEKKDVGSVISGSQSFTNKEAETELLVNDGDTVVIGGIIKSTESDAKSGIPGLSKIPLLGWLFRNKSTSKDDEELLIFITPRIIQLKQRAIQY